MRFRRDMYRGIRRRGGPAGHGFDGDEEDDGPGLVEYWRLLRRRKGTVILIAAIGLIGAVLITLPMTPVYTARTTLEIQDVNQDFMNLRGVQQFSSVSGGWMIMNDIQTQIRILHCASLLDRVLEKLKLETPAALKQEQDRVTAWRRALNLPEATVEDARAAALGMARGSVTARAQGQTRIVEVSVESTDRKLAAQFANVLTAEYIDQNMEAKWQQTQKTGEWLTRQLDDMKIKLERNEDLLQVYAQKSGLLFTEEKSSVNQDRLRQLQTALLAVTGDRVTKQSRYEMAKNASPESLPDVINDIGLRELQIKTTELRRQLAELRATYNDKYPRVQRLEPQVALLEAQYGRERDAILKRIKNEYDEALRKESLLQADYNEQTGRVRTEGERGVHYSILKREVDTNRQLYESMLQKVKEASIASAIRASNIRVVDPARTPGAPSRPSLPRNAGVGLLAGLFLGMAFVVTTDKAKKTIRDPGDVQFYLKVPELGVIPSEKAQVGGYARKKLRAAMQNEKLLLGGAGNGAELAERVELAVHQKKPSMLAESFRATLTSILFTGQSEQKPKALVFTSAGPGDGKSTVVSNMATALGEIHQRVLLIDGDTRKPRIHEIFGVPNELGLTTLLLENMPAAEMDLESVIRPTSVPGVFLLTAGPSVASVTNLLYSGRMEEYLDMFSKLFDMVLIDTSPMLQIPDARVFGRLAGGIIIGCARGADDARCGGRGAAAAGRGRDADSGVRVERLESEGVAGRLLRVLGIRVQELLQRVLRERVVGRVRGHGQCKREDCGLHFIAGAWSRGPGRGCDRCGRGRGAGRRAG